MQSMDNTARRCPNCGSRVAAEGKFCGSCGTPMPPRQVGFCSNCGAPVMEGQEACYSCGSRVTGEMPAPSAASMIAPAEKKPKKKRKAGPGLWAGILAIVLVAIMAVALALLLQPKEAESVQLDQRSVTLIVGQRIMLDYEILPENTPNKSVAWSTSDSGVATVKNGEVVALGQGTCTVTVAADSGVKDTCTVRVVTAQVQELILSQTSLTMHVGDTLGLTCQALPEDASYTLAWSTDNEAVLDVNDGNVTALGVGSGTVTVTADNGVSVSCSVSVESREEERMPLGTWELIRIDDRFSETSHTASGCTIVLAQDLTGTMTQNAAAVKFDWKFSAVDADGDYWYDVSGMEEDIQQLCYSASGDDLSLYGTDETWVFARKP